MATGGGGGLPPRTAARRVSFLFRRSEAAGVSTGGVSKGGGASRQSIAAAAPVPGVLKSQQPAGPSPGACAGGPNQPCGPGHPPLAPAAQRRRECAGALGR